MASGVLRWMHSDPRGLDPAVTDAFARAQRAQWSNDESSRADLRALLVGTLAVAANLGPRKVARVGDSQDLVIVVEPEKSRTDYEWAQTLLLTGVNALICRRELDPNIIANAIPPRATVTLQTDGGKPAEPLGTSVVVIGLAAGIALASGIVIASGLVAGSIWWMHGQDSEVEAVKLTSDAKVQMHAASLASASGMVAQHLDREQAKGASIPWDAHELELLRQLEQSIRETAGWTPPPLKSVPDAGAVTDAVKGAGSGLLAGFGLLELAIVGLLVWRFAKR